MTADSSQFSGERLLLFLERASQHYDEGVDTKQFVEDFGGEVVETVEAEAWPLGVFYSAPYNTLRVSIVAYYDSLSTVAR